MSLYYNSNIIQSMIFLITMNEILQEKCLFPIIEENVGTNKPLELIKEK